MSCTHSCCSLQSTDKLNDNIVNITNTDSFLINTDQMDNVAPAVRTMTKWAEQCRADTGVASWMAGRSRRPQEENTDNILSSQATARTSLRDDGLFISF